MELTKTRTELIREAADKLNIVGTGQSLEDDYAERINVNIDPLLSQLAADGVCNVVNTQYIPAEWFDSLAGLLANVCAPVGGKNYDPQIKQFYEFTLRRLTSSRPSYNVQEADYF
jgi:hypothetical protein